MTDHRPCSATLSCPPPMVSSRDGQPYGTTLDANRAAATCNDHDLPPTRVGISSANASTESRRLRGSTATVRSGHVFSNSRIVSSPLVPASRRPIASTPAKEPATPVSRIPSSAACKSLVLSSTQTKAVVARPVPSSAQKERQKSQEIIELSQERIRKARSSLAAGVMPAAPSSRQRNPATRPKSPQHSPSFRSPTISSTNKSVAANSAITSTVRHRLSSGTAATSARPSIKAESTVPRNRGMISPVAPNDSAGTVKKTASATLESPKQNARKEQLLHEHAEMQRTAAALRGALSKLETATSYEDLSNPSRSSPYRHGLGAMTVSPTEKIRRRQSLTRTITLGSTKSHLLDSKIMGEPIEKHAIDDEQQTTTVTAQPVERLLTPSAAPFVEDTESIPPVPPLPAERRSRISSHLENNYTAPARSKTGTTSLTEENQNTIGQNTELATDIAGSESSTPARLRIAKPQIAVKNSLPHLTTKKLPVQESLRSAGSDILSQSSATSSGPTSAPATDFPNGFDEQFVSASSTPNSRQHISNRLYAKLTHGLKLPRRKTSSNGSTPDYNASLPSSPMLPHVSSREAATSVVAPSPLRLASADFRVESPLPSPSKRSAAMARLIAFKERAIKDMSPRSSPNSSTTDLTLGARKTVWIPEQRLATLDDKDLEAEEEMRLICSRNLKMEALARDLTRCRDKSKAVVGEGISVSAAVKTQSLNLYEKGEILDFRTIYFCGLPGCAKTQGDVTGVKANNGFDDERGDYKVVVGDHLAYRYEVVSLLGKGSFGQVLRCIDHKTGNPVALKIIRNKSRFHSQALVEIKILKNLTEWDPDDTHHLVRAIHNFYFRGHLCISTELLSLNLYEFVTENEFRGLPVTITRRITKQLLSSLCLLQRQSVIHCDLKPENILLSSPNSADVKVIDFGSSCFENDRIFTYIQSRFYRSPEVILGLQYGLPIDMWSLGCIVAELHIGCPLFPGENEQEQLGCIMEVLGPPEPYIVDRSSRRHLFFDANGRPRVVVSSKGRRRIPNTKSLSLACRSTDPAFLDFIAACLQWDPSKRLKPDDAVLHPYITGKKLERPTVELPMTRTYNLPIISPSVHGKVLGARPLPVIPRQQPYADSPVMRLGMAKSVSTNSIGSRIVSQPMPVRRELSALPGRVESSFPDRLPGGRDGNMARARVTANGGMTIRRIPSNSSVYTTARMQPPTPSANGSTSPSSSTPMNYSSRTPAQLSASSIPRAISGSVSVNKLSLLRSTREEDADGVLISER
ncbi:uncharacterized protein V1518DRAFT_422896 [Limtongia smithiae]|uniref:uncharacterized protein n=1 Tax=Limtongia smithiae TaxID=1125753 RepID=UPI0034CF397F